MFALKVKKVDRHHYVSDDHQNGIFDVYQRRAFCHLFPDGFVDVAFIDTLFFLAKLHNWEVEITNN